MNQLWTPWRMAYIKDKRKDKYASGCLFCAIAARPDDGAGSEVFARSSHSFALLNRYPYTFGHSMIVPFQHVATPEDLPAEALADMALMTNRVMRTLREIADPPAFNIGANIGAAAGAGIAAHYHFHVVPRWPGDANFMATIGATQTVPDTLDNLQRKIKAAWQELYGHQSD